MTNSILQVSEVKDMMKKNSFFHNIVVAAQLATQFPCESVRNLAQRVLQDAGKFYTITKPSRFSEVQTLRVEIKGNIYAFSIPELSKEAYSRGLEQYFDSIGFKPNYN